jgi:hypothetical protein
VSEELETNEERNSGCEREGGVEKIQIQGQGTEYAGVLEGEESLKVRMQSHSRQEEMKDE